MSYKILNKEKLNGDENQVFALDVLEGLSKTPKCLPSKYFYDDVGSELFQKITELKEYYPTRCEFEILKKNKGKIFEIINDKGFNLVELGAGDGRKTIILLKYFLEKGMKFDYTPIDISEESMKILSGQLKKKLPKLNFNGIVGEYFEALKWLAADKRPKIVLFLGSNIGNFSCHETRKFLRALWNSLNSNDYVIIGFDLKKDIKIMELAYNDSSGVTSKFNLNILNRINKELGGNFNVSKFMHRSHYNVLSGAIESWIISKEKQNVFIKELGISLNFDEWEGIHTEYSYKYLVSDIKKLAREVAFKSIEEFTDKKSWFVDVLWQVEKS